MGMGAGMGAGAGDLGARLAALEERVGLLEAMLMQVMGPPPGQVMPGQVPPWQQGTAGMPPGPEMWAGGAGAAAPPWGR